jgi:pyruvate formate lyase activating enzyme
MSLAEGFVHSIYTGGMVDGPGIRTVVFFAGCSLRCLYCHNPDTWARGSGLKKSATDVLEEILKYTSYYKFSGGGVTMSGGEPADQPDCIRH